MSRARCETNPMILVLGPGKSGTTALFFCLKAGAERHFGIKYPQKFEPKTTADVDAFAEAFGIVKMLFERYRRTDKSFLPRFDKRIFISRDPRDNVISRLVYYAGTRLKNTDEATRTSILEKFLAKEKDPDSISVLELYDAIGPLLDKPGDAGHAREIACTPAGFLSAHNGVFFNIRYEDFLDGKFSDLEDYLGFRLSSDFRIAGSLQRVRRTMAHGYWKNWFTDEDYDYFVAPKRDALIRMGYDDLAPYRGEKIISPVEISEYLERQLAA